MPKSEPASISPHGSVRVDGNRLRELRLRSGLTQEELAASTGYSDRLVRKLESGGPIQYRTLNDFVSYFRVALQLELETDCFCRTATAYTPSQVMPLLLDGIFNRRDLMLLEQLVHPELTLHADGEILHGRQAFQQRLKPLLAAFEPGKLTIEHLVVDTTSACVYWKARKTHRGEFMGVPATGRPFQIAGNMLAIFSNGVIIEIRDQWNLPKPFRHSDRK